VSSPPLRSHGLTDIGRRRKVNEDAFASDDALGLYVVADGVGGHAKGEIASRAAIEEIFGYVRAERALVDALAARPDDAAKDAVRRLLESAVQNACYMVFGMAEQEPSQRGMSTTISALLIVDAWGLLAQVGDSRIYLIRAGRAEQLTEDHTLINYRLKLGEITAEQARTMKGRNVITRAVGHMDYVEVDMREVDVHAGDRFLLCSDGLHGYLREGELESLLVGDDAAAVTPPLIALANDRGGRDNITALVVVVG
jgi:protein phosphatase